VVATTAMPADAWRRAKVFAWLADLLYFDRLVQVPIAVLSARHGIPLRAFVEQFLDADAERSPTVAGIVAMLADQARAVQAGGTEFMTGERSGARWWPADQFALIELVRGDRLAPFYREAEQLVLSLLASLDVAEEPIVVGELFDLNAAILRRPTPAKDAIVLTTHAVDAAYRAVLAGEAPEVAERWTMLSVDRTTKAIVDAEGWFAHLVWCYGKDKRGYLSPVRPASGRAFSRQPAPTV
jgi:hypothetical protein